MFTIISGGLQFHKIFQSIFSPTFSCYVN